MLVFVCISKKDEFWTNARNLREALWTLQTAVLCFHYLWQTLLWDLQMYPMRSPNRRMWLSIVLPFLFSRSKNLWKLLLLLLPLLVLFKVEKWVSRLCLAKYKDWLERKNHGRSHTPWTIWRLVYDLPQTQSRVHLQSSKLIMSNPAIPFCPKCGKPYEECKNPFHPRP